MSTVSKYFEKNCMQNMQLYIYIYLHDVLLVIVRVDVRSAPAIISTAIAQIPTYIYLFHN